MNVELVNTITEDGVRLDGTLWLPPGRNSHSRPFDAAILHHGVGANFYVAHFFEEVQEKLAALGCPALRVNNRGHDIAYNSPKGRLGAAYEVVDDCRLDFRAWLDFAAARGYGRVLFWGHSLGAVKTIYYMAKEQDPRVPCAIATSPPLFSYSAYSELAGAERFHAHYDEARALVEAGRPDDVFPITVPTNSLLAARTYVDKYGPEERYNILTHIPAVQVPMLVAIGSEEGLGPEASDWFPFGNLAGKIEDMSATLDLLSFELVQGANHMYVGKVEELWGAALRWLEQMAVPA